MTTAIIGLGNIGKSVARHLVDGGERVVLAARGESNATALANELGELASATSVEKAITDADVVVFAVWLDTLKDLIAQHADLLKGKVMIVPQGAAADAHYADGVVGSPHLAGVVQDLPGHSGLEGQVRKTHFALFAQGAKIPQCRQGFRRVLSDLRSCQPVLGHHRSKQVNVVEFDVHGWLCSIPSQAAGGRMLEPMPAAGGSPGARARRW